MANRTEHKRVSFALACVKNWRDQKLNLNDLSTVVDGFPAMIRMNGIGQAMAFAKSKKGMHAKVYIKVYIEISAWLCDVNNAAIYKGNDFIEAMVNGSQTKYRQSQVEALLLLNWLKKLVRAESLQGS